MAGPHPAIVIRLICSPCSYDATSPVTRPNETGTLGMSEQRSSALTATSFFVKSVASLFVRAIRMPPLMAMAAPNRKLPTSAVPAAIAGFTLIARPHSSGRRVSHLVLLRYLELWIAVGVEGDGDEVRPAAYCTVLGVDLPRATTGIHEGVVLLAAERARVGHGFSGYRKVSLLKTRPS